MPCHEKWDDMSAVDKGRFCSSCQKTVTDFTNASDREIVAALRSERNLCGRFLSSQVNRELKVPTKKSNFWIAAASGFLAMLWPSDNIKAQEPQVQTQLDSDKKSTTSKATRPVQKRSIIAGVVLDANGPLYGVNIIIKGKRARTVTDKNGAFSIKARPGDVIIANYIGMRDYEFTVKHVAQPIKIEMEEGGIMLGGIGYHPIKIQNTFYSIANRFKVNKKTG